MRELMIGEFAKIQSDLNEKTLKDWSNVLTEDHMKTAILSELSELQGEIPWKWWKKPKSVNRLHIYLEAIDVLHFSLSLLILKSGGDILDNDYLPFQFDSQSTSMFGKDGFLNHSVFMQHTFNLLTNGTISDIEDFFCSLRMDSEIISATYVSKVELNNIRQEGGFKSGRYNKMKDGIEDNDRLEEPLFRFLNDEKMMLDDLRKSVREVFTVSGGSYERI